MQRSDLLGVLALIEGNWGPLHASRDAVLGAWWRYLGDLDPAAVTAAVDRLVLDGRPFAPRPGEIRRAVRLAGLDLPSEDAAWTQATAWLRAAETGTALPVLSVEVSRALTGAGMTGTSRADRDAFGRSWARVVAEIEAPLLALPGEPPGTSPAGTLPAGTLPAGAPERDSPTPPDQDPDPAPHPGPDRPGRGEPQSGLTVPAEPRQRHPTATTTANRPRTPATTPRTVQAHTAPLTARDGSRSPQ